MIILKTLIGVVTASVLRDIKDSQKMERLWRDHLPQFVEMETQNVVGTRKKRTLPDFTRLAAARVILPTWKELLKHYLKRDLAEKIASDIECKRGVNHVIHGSPVVSELSQLEIFKYEHAIDFGYVTSAGITYEVKPQDYEEASKTEVTSKEWIIVDKDSKQVLVRPARKADGTYYSDGAIVMRGEDPYCGPSTGGLKTYFLGFLGTHAAGSYAANGIIRIPGFVDKFERALHDNNIHEDPFIAALEIKFEPYSFGIPPEDDRIRDIEIKRIEKLEKLRK